MDQIGRLDVSRYPTERWRTSTLWFATAPQSTSTLNLRSVRKSCWRLHHLRIGPDHGVYSSVLDEIIPHSRNWADKVGNCHGVEEEEPS